MNYTKSNYVRNTIEKQPTLFIQAFFFVICCFILLNLPSDRPYVAGADASSWLLPAKSLLLHHNYVIFDHPEYADLYRPPIVPIFNAFFLWLGQENGVKTIVFAQIVLLSITSLLVARIANMIRHGTGIIAMVLFLVNPNTFSSAFLIQSETIFVFLLTFSIYALLQYLDSDRWSHVIKASFFLALATLTRPTTQYLIIAFPLACFVLVLMRNKYEAFTFQRFSQGLVATGLAILLVMPWALKLGESEGSPTLTTAEIRSVYIYDQLLTLVSYKSGISIKDAHSILSKDKTHEKKMKCYELEYNSPERAGCFQEVEALYTRKLLGQPFVEYVRPIIKSFINFFFSGGSGNWHNLFMTEDKYNVVSIASNIDNQQSFNMVSEIIANFSFVPIIIIIFCLFFSLAIKLMTLVGIYDLFRRKEFAVLMVFLALIFYFFMVTLFLGQSRYRIPLEPYFTILAVIGWLKFKEIFRDRIHRKLSKNLSF